MKKLLSLLVAIVSLNAMAQSEKTEKADVPLSRKYQMLVELEEPMAILENNREMKIATDNARATAKMADADNSEQKSVLLTSITKGFTNTLIKKGQGIGSNVASTSVDYLLNKIKGEKKKWYKSAQSHCTLYRKLESDIKIKDFYSAPSSLGAMDPQNIQFKGFGCHQYLEEQNNPDFGKEVFYIFCKMRRDEEGINSIVNHSKFLVDIDSLIFDPKYCGLPNDSLEVITAFDFSKRKNLTLTITARIYSSWINEAIMVNEEQQLGEFTISAIIDSSLVAENKDSVFIYRKGDPRYENLVSVTGDCFIVPRSFTGTSDGTTYSSTWGTGQYRIEMEITESCRIVNEYYYKDKYQNELKATGKHTARSKPDFGKMHKKKWKAEWKPIKEHQNAPGFWSLILNSIVTASKGTSWVQTYTEPQTNYISNYQGTQLRKSLGFSSSEASGNTTHPRH